MYFAIFILLTLQSLLSMEKLKETLRKEHRLGSQADLTRPCFPIHPSAHRFLSTYYVLGPETGDSTCQGPTEMWALPSQSTESSGRWEAAENVTSGKCCQRMSRGLWEPRGGAPTPPEGREASFLEKLAPGEDLKVSRSEPWY